MLINFYRKYLINISHASFTVDDVSVCAAAVALDSCVTRKKETIHTKSFLLQNLLQADRERVEQKLYLYKWQKEIIMIFILC